MPDFKELQAGLQQIRKNLDAGSKSVFLAREKLRKLERERQQLRKIAAENTEAYQALVQQEKEVTEWAAREGARWAEYWKEQEDLQQAFEQFTDPRMYFEKLPDDVPVLLFPVRLETRFKIVPIGMSALQHQLWVRIFPDDCSIDTFDDTLSESELTRARNYWINIWKAGKPGNEPIKSYIQNKKKGAWRELMGTWNAGRAYWITQTYYPVNADDIPPRVHERDVLLIVPVEQVLRPQLHDALTDYWKAFYLANGDATKTRTAFTAFRNAVGGNEEDTRRIIDIHTPANIGDERIEGETPPNVTVAFIQFPRSDNVATKLFSWSRAARVTTFPDRFVLLAYQKDNPNPVINELGNQIPDPLVVGPDPGEDINAVLKAAFRDDFEALQEEEKAEKYVEYLTQRSDTRWLFDFEEAVKVGMAFKVNLSASEYSKGFEQLFVLGVKLSADGKEAKSLLEQLIAHHHFGDSGFSILPQGTPTNNTEDSPSGFSETEDADEAFARYQAEVTENDPTGEVVRRDGRWLADLLGIDVDNATLPLVANYYHKDQCEARAMNTALWNATLGHFMESMLTPVFNDRQRELTRWFLVNHISGRGRIPAIRIGDQPYGILPISNIGDKKWLENNKRLREEYPDTISFLEGLYSLLHIIRGDWSRHLEKVAYVRPGKDAHEILLKALGLHATSIQFGRRNAESSEHLYNLLKLKGKYFQYYMKGLQLLHHLEYFPNEFVSPHIPLLDKFFFTEGLHKEKPLIDDRPDSEIERIRLYTDEGWNYIEWLIENARNDHSKIKNEEGFTQRKKPNTVLYRLLRHALNLEFFNSGVKLYTVTEVLSPAQADAARIDANFIGIQQEKKGMESKWDLLYRKESRIAGGEITVVDHISSMLRNNAANSEIRQANEVLAALELLKHTPTARLERALVEHLDCCSYRLDAWLLGFVNLQLYAMRYGGEFTEDKPKKDIYLGAYGWVEDLKSKDQKLEEAKLEPDMAAIFDPTGEDPPRTDDTNAGYVHAPSVGQARTAAVLLNAYISKEEDKEVFKVNLSSERMRLALSMIEGIQQGQSLSALLGYQLERGLHDRAAKEKLDLDIYIYELREEFPLVANRMPQTEIKRGRTPSSPAEAKRFREEEQELEEEQAITKIEARNVVDGLALLDHIKKTRKETYPFGFPKGKGPGKLKSADSKHSQAIDAEVSRLMNIRDAVADLAITEGIHQVVQGNYERAAGTLESYSKGGHPQFPDVIQTPSSGVSLTHRFGIHLPHVFSSNDATPRSKAEPAVNEWLKDLFPDDLSMVGCMVKYRDPNYEGGPPGDVNGKPVTMADLKLQPIDLLYMLDVESEKNLTALDDCILKVIHQDANIRPDIELEIRYTEPPDGKISLFEIAALVRSLRSLIVSSRPLQPNDMTLQGEAKEGQNTTSAIDPTRINEIYQGIGDIRTELFDDFIDVLDGLIDPEDFEITLGNKAQILPQIDTLTGHFINYLHQLSLFGIPQTGFGFVYDRKRAIYAAVYKKVLDYKKQWEDKKAKYDDLMTVQLPAAVNDEEKIIIMQKAEQTISMTYSVPVPSVPDYQAVLVTKKNNFDQKYGDLETFLNGQYSTFASLFGAVNGLKPNLGDFDLSTIETEDEERQIVVFAEDTYIQAKKLFDTTGKKLDTVENLLADHDVSSVPKDKLQLLTRAAKTLLGEEFQIVPGFTLSTEQGSEIQSCLNNQAGLLNYQVNVQSNDFPMDDWLYGMARVREKTAAWENMVMLAEGFKDRQPLNLTPIQLPFNAGDSWLGLSYPDNLDIEGDRLLYTAYLSGFDPGEIQYGLMVDEWTEVIPAEKETTGLTFHYDRPNAEPPQTLLLVTPSAGSVYWQWEDLVASLQETLNLAKLRAFEPDHIDKTPYAQFLPATVAAITTHPVTIAIQPILD